MTDLISLWRPARRWVWGVFALIALASVVFSLADVSWAGWQPATCMPDDCFCEAIRPGPIAQPVNTYSNLAFVLVGLLILGASPARPVTAGPADGRANLMLSQPAYPIVLGASTVVIGLGSLFYHASLSFAGQWFDVMGMYLLATFMALYGLARIRPMRGWLFALIYAAVNGVLGALLIAVPEIRRQIFAGLILAVIALEGWITLRRRPPMRYAYFGAALVSFAAAYAIWLLDNARVLCAPGSVLQGHALWHIGGALAAGLIYAYYRSEQIAAPTAL
ncbi:MAG: ceramidase domain-containing protein [Candidatus Roseilinea sp.]|uniref:ceramidase domain-containing protein n=1 Tax=Candidatus Roseilinea sp. TaxID=2838777 RepID=UPI004049DC32